MSGYFLASFIAEEKDPVEVSFTYALSNPFEAAFGYPTPETTVINVTPDGISVKNNSN